MFRTVSIIAIYLNKLGLFDPEHVSLGNNTVATSRRDYSA